MDKMLLKTEADHYRQIAADLKASYESLDDETLKDTLEVISDLPEMIEQIIRSSLDDDVMIVGLKARLDQMSERLSRFKLRYERKREIAGWAMGLAGLQRLEVQDFTVTLRDGNIKLEVVEEKQIPPAFLITQPPRLDRSSLTDALKRGEVIVGARLIQGRPYVAVRLK